MCSEYELLAMLTVCTEERTIRQRLLTVRNSAAVLNMTGRRGRESWIHVPLTRKSPESNTWSSESTTWNPESLSVFDYLIRRDGSFGDCTRPKHRKKHPFSTTGKVENVIKLFFFHYITNANDWASYLLFFHRSKQSLDSNQGTWRPP